MESDPITLTHAEHMELGRAQIETLKTEHFSHIREAVERIVVARVAAAVEQARAEERQRIAGAVEELIAADPHYEPRRGALEDVLAALADPEAGEDRG